MKSKAVSCVLDMVHERKASEAKTSEYRMSCIIQNGCRHKVRREGQI
jgi:hypothetical protein